MSNDTDAFSSINMHSYECISYLSYLKKEEEKHGKKSKNTTFQLRDGRLSCLLKINMAAFLDWMLYIFK